MSEEQSTNLRPTAILEHPFVVVDGVVGEVLRNNFPEFLLRWEQHTSGSSRHIVTDQSNRELFQVWVRAIRFNDTVLSVITASDMVQPVEFGLGLVTKILQESALDQARLEEIKRQILPEITTNPQDNVKRTMEQRGSPGRPRISETDHEEYMDRLVFAHEAEEIRAKNPIFWREIARLIKWPMGDSKEGVKALERARKELKNASKEILAEVVERRTKTTQKT